MRMKVKDAKSTWAVDLLSHDQNTRCLRMFVGEFVWANRWLEVRLKANRTANLVAGGIRNDHTQDTKHANEEEDGLRFWAFESPFQHWRQGR